MTNKNKIITMMILLGGGHIILKAPFEQEYQSKKPMSVQHQVSPEDLYSNNNRIIYTDNSIQRRYYSPSTNKITSTQNYSQNDDAFVSETRYGRDSTGQPIPTMSYQAGDILPTNERTWFGYGKQKLGRALQLFAKNQDAAKTSNQQDLASKHLRLNDNNIKQRVNIKGGPGTTFDERVDNKDGSEQYVQYNPNGSVAKIEKHGANWDNSNPLGSTLRGDLDAYSVNDKNGNSILSYNKDRTWLGALKQNTGSIFTWAGQNNAPAE